VGSLLGQAKLHMNLRQRKRALAVSGRGVCVVCGDARSRTSGEGARKTSGVGIFSDGAKHRMCVCGFKLLPSLHGSLEAALNA
jgi:hypothetical protein